MLLKNVKFAAVVAFAGLFSVAACGDDGEETTATTATTANPTGSGLDCNMVCGDLYACGLEDGNCPAFADGSVDEMTFLNGSADNPGGCLATCNSPSGAAIAGLVDSSDCAATVQSISGLSMDFANSCTGDGSGGGGAGGGSAGGAGGTGGTGGAGGGN